MKTLAKLSQMCLKRSILLEGLFCGPCIWEYWGKSTTKNYHPVRRPTMDSNLNNKVVENYKRCGLFSDFHYGFRSSLSTLDFLEVVSDRFSRALDRFGTVPLDISKGFYRVCHIGLLQKLIPKGISGWLFVFILSFLRNNWLWLDLDGKSL